MRRLQAGHDSLSGGLMETPAWMMRTYNRSDAPIRIHYLFDFHGGGICTGSSQAG
jgi:hypothetical protein